MQLPEPDLEQDLDRCTTLQEVVARVDDSIANGPYPTQGGKLRGNDDAQDLMLIVAMDKQKKVAWIQSKRIKVDGEIKASLVGIDLSTIEKIQKSLDEKKRFGLLDSLSGPYYTKNVWHRFIVYRNETHRPRAEALSFLVQKYNAEVDKIIKLDNRDAQALFHARIGLLLGYTVNDVALYLEHHQFSWPELTKASLNT